MFAGIVPKDETIHYNIHPSYLKLVGEHEKFKVLSMIYNYAPAMTVPGLSCT
jgi:hypothetical protein